MSSDWTRLLLLTAAVVLRLLVFFGLALVKINIYVYCNLEIDYCNLEID